MSHCTHLESDITWNLPLHLPQNQSPPGVDVDNSGADVMGGGGFRVEGDECVESVVVVDELVPLEADVAVAIKLYDET